MSDGPPGYDGLATTPRRPLRAEVYQKQLTGIQQAIILAMLEIGDSSGRCLKISVPRIAAWSKFDEKSVQRALWGDHRTHPGQPKPKREKGQPDKECPFCPNCLISRRVLELLAPASWKGHRPARYRLNLEILDDCPEVRHYLDQRNLNFPPAPEKRPTVASPSDPRSLAQRPTVASPSDPRSHDSKAFDSRTFDSRTFDSRASGFKSSSQLSQEPPARGVCDECNGFGRLHQRCDVPGPRLIPCWKCRTQQKQEDS